MIRLSQQQNARTEIKTPKKISWKTRKLTIKALLKSQGGYSILDTPEGGLFKKLNEKDIYGTFISLSLYILQIQHTISGVEYINSTEFYPKLYEN